MRCSPARNARRQRRRARDRNSRRSSASTSGPMSASQLRRPAKIVDADDHRGTALRVERGAQVARERRFAAAVDAVDHDDRLHRAVLAQERAHERDELAMTRAIAREASPVMHRVALVIAERPAVAVGEVAARGADHDLGRTGVPVVLAAERDHGVERTDRERPCASSMHPSRSSGGIPVSATTRASRELGFMRLTPIRSLARAGSVETRQRAAARRRHRRLLRRRHRRVHRVQRGAIDRADRGDTVDRERRRGPQTRPCVR